MKLHIIASCSAIFCLILPACLAKNLQPRQDEEPDVLGPRPRQQTGSPAGEDLPKPRAGYQCGQGVTSSRSGDVERIVNGTFSVPDNFPFMANLKYVRGGGHFCGGAIYDKYTVITAAHCLTGKVPERLKMTFGDWNQRANEEGEVKIFASELIMHESYGTYQGFNKGYYDDIAIVKLSTPLTWSDKIQPICLPSGPITNEEPARVIGWGTTSGTGDKNTLRVVDLPILTEGSCTRYGWIKSYWIQPGKQICAGYEEGMRDSCAGDSGGPLFSVRNGFYELVGVVSWGFQCALPKLPGVYQDVYRYIDWIKTTVGEPQY